MNVREKKTTFSTVPSLPVSIQLRRFPPVLHLLNQNRSRCNLDRPILPQRRDRYISLPDSASTVIIKDTLVPLVWFGDADRLNSNSGDTAGTIWTLPCLRTLFTCHYNLWSFKITLICPCWLRCWAEPDFERLGNTTSSLHWNNYSANSPREYLTCMWSCPVTITSWVSSWFLILSHLS